MYANYLINKWLLCVCFSFLFLSLANSQDQASHWYFGFNAGINIEDDTVEALTISRISTNEGCATISNKKGELLFYTDGVTVWDKNHDVMPNGTGLMGDESSTQSAVIVPKPNSETIYYIFTVINFGRAEGLRYSEVDMSLNGGRGDVTSNKNIFLIAPCTEKISAVQHSNGLDYWVSTHLWESDQFATFKVTENGVETTPVMSTVGSYHGGVNYNLIGCMKFSPNGKKVALTRWSTGSIAELFDFDKATGEVSNAVLLDNVFGQDYLNGAYGLEFSKDSKYLYVSDLDQQKYTSELHQFDISVFTQAAIKASDVVISSERKIIAGMQLAPNGKIYVANTFSSYLSVIESPTSKGLNCDYQSRVVSLSGRSAIFGLPSFVQSFFIGNIEFENNCLNQEVVFNVNTGESIDSVLWDFGDGEMSTEINPKHEFPAIGEYVIQATFKSGSCTYNIAKAITVFDLPVANQVSNYVFCEDVGNDGIESFDLSTKTSEVLGTQDIANFEVNYFETFVDAADNTNALPNIVTNKSNTQEVYARISNKENIECYDVTSFKLIVETEQAGAPADLVICDDKSNDGVEKVNLAQFDVTVYNGSPEADYLVTYYTSQTDADIGFGGLDPSTFETSSNNETVFTRLEHIETGCFSTSSFKIVINEMLTAYQPENLFLCDYDSNDGKEIFDLGSQNDLILNGQAGKVTYHLSLAEATLNLGALPESYPNERATQEIFARVESFVNSECYDITSFYIQVNSQPIIDIDAVWYLCPGETVQLYTNSVHDEYIWDSGETTSDIVVDQAGDYAVTVYNLDANNNSCSVTRTITVVDVEVPTSVDIEINDWTTNRNTVSINLESNQEYLYSLNGQIYKSTPTFDNVEAGEHTVYIRNEIGCIVYSKEIYLLNYPKFFTPNNDGYHDYWKIEFAETEPDLVVNIFDRYGKLIKQLNSSSRGWDGTFNGYPLSTSDYWFVVNRPSKNAQYQGHFTLKR